MRFIAEYRGKLPTEQLLRRLAVESNANAAKERANPSPSPNPNPNPNPNP